jgi:hypothetical protein
VVALPDDPPPAPRRKPGELTDDERLAIAGLFKAGWELSELAKLYGVELAVIEEAVKARSKGRGYRRHLL